MLFSWRSPKILGTASGNLSVGQFIGVDIDSGRKLNRGPFVEPEVT